MRPGSARGFPRTPVSIVTISSALASGGDVIGRALAEELTYTFADREIILKAAERLGQGVAELERLLESRPTLRERLLETRRDYLAAVEAVIWEFAARDNVVLVGRGSTFVLQRIRHAFRLRVTAPVHVRARRLEAERGLVPDAEEVIARSDRDWAARIRHLYDVALDDPLQYDLVLNSARLDTPAAVATVRAALAAERFRATPQSLAEARDRGLTARVHAALLCHPRTRELGLFFSCRDGHVSLSGRVARDDQRRIAEEVVQALPGVDRVLSEIVVILPPAGPPGP
jgi:cytidylate kinase